jgi:sortase (surface protein transpeptidase)
VEPSQTSQITLITCTGWDTKLGHYIKRLIVAATLDEVVPIAVRGY